MKIEPGQLRVWGDVITRDKTPFLIIGRNPNYRWSTDEWEIMWAGKIQPWTGARIAEFSEVISEAG